MFEPNRRTIIFSLAIAFVIGSALLCARMNMVFSDNYIPFVRGGSEISDLYIQSWNLLHADPAKHGYLADFTVQDIGGEVSSPTYVHAPNLLQRLVGVGLLTVGVTDFSTFTYAALVVFGALAILALLTLAFVLQSWTLSVVLFGLLLIDVMSFTAFLNSYRSIQFVLFYGLIALIAWHARTPPPHCISLSQQHSSSCFGKWKLYLH